jgi:prepilin peptidase CpaA
MSGQLALCVLVAILASGEDIWRRRVSNFVTLGAFVAGVALQTYLGGLAGLGDSLLGGFYGFAVFLVFFLLGGMGGGDIKLMAAFGAILGGDKIWLAAILTGILGAVFALFYLVVVKLLRFVRPGESDPNAPPARKAMIPYAPAISLGVLLALVPEMKFLD